MKGKRSPGAGLFDKLLVPRLENYASNNDVTDIEAACDYLRRCYKEYQRQKLPALRQQVERAVDVIARKGGVTKSELRLQVGACRSGAGPHHACGACELPATHRPSTASRAGGCAFCVHTQAGTRPTITVLIKLWASRPAPPTPTASRLRSGST